MTTDESARRRYPAWRRVLGHPLAHLAMALIVVAVVQLVFVKVYQVPSASMEQTLQPGDRVLVNRLAYVIAEIDDGDVVVFDRPDDWPSTPSDAGPLRVAAGWIGDIFGFGPSNGDALAKRVIGTPGQTVECCDELGRVIRNGTGIDEPYLGSDLPFESGVLDCETSPRSSRCFAPITLPDDHYLMLGDNRTNSNDSVTACRGRDLVTSNECARLVSRDDVIGAVFFVLLPFDRWGQSLTPLS